MIKMIFCILAMFCGIVATVFGAKSYMVSLRNELRLKYHRITTSNEYVRSEQMQKEYEKKLYLTITFLVMLIILSVAVSCLVLLTD